MRHHNRDQAQAHGQSGVRPEHPGHPGTSGKIRNIRNIQDQGKSAPKTTRRRKKALGCGHAPSRKRQILYPAPDTESPAYLRSCPSATVRKCEAKRRPRKRVDVLVLLKSGKSRGSKGGQNHRTSREGGPGILGLHPGFAGLILATSEFWLFWTAFLVAAAG